MSEKQNELIKHWESKKYFVVNNITTNKNGLPDLTASKPNHTVYIESKEEWDRLRPNQVARLNQLTRLGFDCYVNYDKWEITRNEPDTELF